MKEREEISLDCIIRREYKRERMKTELSSTHGPWALPSAVFAFLPPPGTIASSLASGTFCC